MKPRYWLTQTQIHLHFRATWQTDSPSPSEALWRLAWPRPLCSICRLSSEARAVPLLGFRHWWQNKILNKNFFLKEWKAKKTQLNCIHCCVHTGNAVWYLRMVQYCMCFWCGLGDGAWRSLGDSYLFIRAELLTWLGLLWRLGSLRQPQVHLQSWPQLWQARSPGTLLPLRLPQ